jgi:hypothetical protein
MIPEEVRVGNLAEDLSPEAAAPTDHIREALATPYTLARWREDMRHARKGVETGFDCLAALGMRWQPGYVYGVAARPGGGKTAFLLEACCRYLERDDTSHAVFVSYEEPLSAVVLRLVLRADAVTAAAVTADGVTFKGAPIPREAVREFARADAGATMEDRRLAAACDRVARLLERLHLVDGDTIGHDIRKVLAGLAAWKREPGAPAIGLVAVDYFQKLRTNPAAARMFSRQHELQAVSDYLRRFAKGAALAGDGSEVDTIDPAHAVPVLVGAQVTRGQGAHPSGESIREADDLLNDVGGLLALSWEAGEERNARDDDELRYLRVSVPKHREGATRPDDFARVPWRPARSYLAERSVREESGRTVWTPVKTLEPEDNPPRRQKREGNVMDKTLPSRRPSVK